MKVDVDVGLWIVVIELGKVDDFVVVESSFFYV